MEIEHLFRSTALAVGLKPSAMECKARLRGLYRIISSKTISPPITADYDCSPQGLHDVRQGFSPPVTTPADRFCRRSLRDARAAIRAGDECGLKPSLRA